MRLKNAPTEHVVLRWEGTRGWAAVRRSRGCVFAGQIVVDHIDANGLGTQGSIVVFFDDVVDHIGDIILNLFIVGFEVLFIVVFDRPSEIFVVQKRIENLLFDVLNLELVYIFNYITICTININSYIRVHNNQRSLNIEIFVSLIP